MAMAFSKSKLFSSLRSSSQQNEPNLSLRRRYHIDLGAREKALLEEDPALKRFRSYKNSAKQASKIGNGLMILVLAACSYEVIAVRATKA